MRKSKRKGRRRELGGEEKEGWKREPGGIPRVVLQLFMTTKI